MTSICLKRSALMKKLIKFNNAFSPALLPSASVVCNNKRHLNGLTIDPADAKHLSKYATDWWNPEGSVKALHSFNVIRVPFIRDSLITMTPDTPQSTCLKGKKILEVGCGPGILTEDLCKLGAEMTGLDPNKDLLDAAIEHRNFNTNLTNKPTYVHTTIEEHCKENINKYDAVVASEVIEHINYSQRELFIESCVKVLKPGGKIIFTTPNRTRISQLLGIYLVEALNVVPKGTHHYHKFSTQEELKYWLEINDCRVDHTRGYVYYFWAHRWEWIKWEALIYLSASLSKYYENSKNSLNNVRQTHSTVDPADVKVHSDSWKIWWDPNGKLKALHSFNLIRVPFVRDALVQCEPEERTSTPLKGKTILDVGCGGGILSEAFARLGAQVTGVDASKDLIEVAQEHCKIDPKIADNKPTYICTTIEEHAEQHKNHYDAVVASEIIEHVNEKELFVKSCVETLKPGGTIFFTTPCRTRLAQVLGIFLMERVLRVIPVNTHQYEKFMTPTELSFLLERNNCHVELIHGLIYNPYTNRWRFISSPNLVFAMQAVKLK
ncbi:ubiquinone biosynthesis O-methyltransferase, mitochondrial [Epargyreus clarus]|uniref:ubiquinone biosynthesis O-methyltransferase, mitochondrial n=1 Tax=Epargyreus clarus TaxID=520877 RepID=UPI003C2DBB41